jgi:protease-4
MDNQIPPTPPPQFQSPPPLITPPRPALPARKSRGWMLVALILAVLLLVSFASNLAHFAENLVSGKVHNHATGPTFEEVVLEDNDSPNKIAVINVDGVISGGADDSGYDFVELIKEQLTRADEDDAVKAVLLKVNSPGGEVLASDDIYKAIVRFQEDAHEKHGKPVVCSMGSLAASGGYYVSAPCRWIVANELTITGSIGVIMHGYNYRGLMDKVGLKREVFKSGKFKDMMSPDRSDAEIPAEERAMVQNLIDETYEKFKGIVADGRNHAHELNKKDGHELATNWTEFADGRILSGKQALGLGLVDEIGDYDDAIERTIKIAGLGKDSANVVEYQPKHDFSEFLRRFSKSDARGVKVDLGMDFPKLRAGYMYFLSPTFLH